MTGHQPTRGTVRHSNGSDRAREEACLTGGMYSAEYVFTGVVDMYERDKMVNDLIKVFTKRLNLSMTNGVNVYA